MTASRMCFLPCRTNLNGAWLRGVLSAIGTQSQEVAGKIKRRLPVKEAALFRGSEYMIIVIPGRLEEPNPGSRDSGFDASHRPGMTILRTSAPWPA
ncbi:hypothetical protein EHH60_16045 [Bradyrhizobium sp. RP6]|nr:hypothetical protein EHH60_16045 [Bradyrhizobium sp. RP6]